MAKDVTARVTRSEGWWAHLRRGDSGPVHSGAQDLTRLQTWFAMQRHCLVLRWVPLKFCRCSTLIRKECSLSSVSLC